MSLVSRMRACPRRGHRFTMTIRCQVMRNSRYKARFTSAHGLSIRRIRRSNGRSSTTAPTSVMRVASFSFRSNVGRCTDDRGVRSWSYYHGGVKDSPGFGRSVCSQISSLMSRLLRPVSGGFRFRVLLFYFCFRFTF